MIKQIELDTVTQDHLETWLAQYDDVEYRDATRTRILAFVAAHPDSIELGRSWPQMRDIAERNEREGID
ncbi:MAG: hypothetical protein ACREBG_08000 [Pyrinomonadaceae bacterium]